MLTVVTEGAKHNYREILTEKCQYKEVVPLDNPELSTLIHLNFRIIFIKVSHIKMSQSHKSSHAYQDVVLASTLDDSLFSLLNSMIIFNNVEIVKILQACTNKPCIKYNISTTMCRKMTGYSWSFSTGCKIRRCLYPRRKIWSGYVICISFLESLFWQMKFLFELCKLAQSLRPDDKADFFRVKSTAISLLKPFTSIDRHCVPAIFSTFSSPRWFDTLFPISNWQ